MRLVRLFLGLVIAGIIIAGPIYFFRLRKAQFRNFHVVKEGVLYRSGQLNLEGLQRLVHDRGIKTVITLRFSPIPGAMPPDLAEESFCHDLGLKHVRIPYRMWWLVNGSIPADKGVDMFLEVMRDPANYPVLIHCFAGIHRTGAYCAIYRMEFENWSNEQAMAEMKVYGYVEEHPDVFSYLEHYRRKAPTLAEPPLAHPSIKPASHDLDVRK
jgi:protein tyrosine/serine phosphatase